MGSYRAPVKPRVVGPKTTGLGQGYADAAAGGGGIVANAHPEFEKGPQLGNPISQIKGAYNALQGYFEKARADKAAAEDRTYKHLGDLANANARLRIANKRKVMTGNG